MAAKRDDIFELRVSPALISKSSTLSSVKYDNNGISIYIKDNIISIDSKATQFCINRKSLFLGDFNHYESNLDLN